MDAGIRGEGAINTCKTSLPQKLLKALRKDYQLYLLALPAIVYFIIFHYGPMYGIQIAFKDFIASKGILGSPWVGFKHFERFFASFQFWKLIRNTVGLSVYSLAAGFPVPIILALMLNQTSSKTFKKIIQTVTYAPHFISVVVMAGILHIFLSPRSGIVNLLIDMLGGQRIFFMGEPGWFKSIYVWSGVWQNMGWGTIIYLAALSGVSPELYEAAKVDGAGKWQILKNVDIPSLLPTVVILLVLNMGSLMSVGFEKVFLLQTSLNISTSEIISTYTYQVGLVQSQYGYSAAIGLFNTAINIVLLVTVNKISRRLTETSLW